MDLTEPEDIKKKWQENTEELHKKDLNDPDNHNGSHHHGYMQSTSCKMLDWMSYKLELRLLGEIATTSDMQMIAFQGQKAKRNLRSLLMRVQMENENVLRLNIQKTKIMAARPIISQQIQVEKVEAVIDFLFLGSKITVDEDCSHEIRRHLLLGRKAVTKPR